MGTDQTASQSQQQQQSFSLLPGAETTAMDNNRAVSPMELPSGGGQQQLPPAAGGGNNSSHILSLAAKEIQEAVKDLDITRQVRDICPHTLSCLQYIL